MKSIIQKYPSGTQGPNARDEKSEGQLVVFHGKEGSNVQILDFIPISNVSGEEVDRVQGWEIQFQEGKKSVECVTPSKEEEVKLCQLIKGAE